MVEKWVDNTNSPIFLMLDDDESLDWTDKIWLYVELYASSSSYTEFTNQSSNELVTIHSPSLFFPMQWTRICLSFNSNTLKAILVVDGEQLVARVMNVTDKPRSLSIILGAASMLESLGRIRM